MFADARQLKMDCRPFVMPPQRVNVQYAAENYMMLKGGGGLTKWKASKTPYLIEPMNCLVSRLYRAVGFMGPARSGKTEALLKATVAHAVKCDPSDVLIVHMNQNESEYFSKTEIETMLKASKDLKDRLSPKLRDNNVGFIRLKAGNVIKLAWPTDATFRGKSFKYVLLTDYDAIRPPSEGDVLTLSLMRTKSYQSSGMVLAESSPAHAVTDLSWKPELNHPHECAPSTGIASIYMSGDRRRYYWKCPECGEYFIPEFEDLIFDRDSNDPVKAASDVFMACPHCAGVINESLKNSLNAGGTWLKQGESIDVNDVITGQGLVSSHATFWMSGVIAGFSRWGTDFVHKYINARRAIELTNDDRGMQAFINTDCGRPYIPEPDEDINADTLSANRIGIPLGTVPSEGKILLASVDVQGGKHRRFVCQVHAIGDGKKQWIVDRFDITSVTDSEGRLAPIKPNLHHEHWNELNKHILDRWYKTEDGVYLKVAAMACDSNGEAGVTQNAYEYYRNAPAEYKSRIYLVKGASSEQEKLVEKYKPKHTVDKTKRKAKKRGNVPLLMLNTNKLKDIVSRNMQVEAGLPLSMMYSHELEDSFYSELMAEKRNTAGKWIHESGANEAFDLCVYVWALMVLKGLVEQETFARPSLFTKLSEDEPDKKPITRKRRRR